MPEVIDEVGRPCPHPLIALGRALHRLAPGTEVLLRADDPVVCTDVPVWCDMVGARLLGIDSEEDGTLAVRLILP